MRRWKSRIAHRRFERDDQLVMVFQAVLAFEGSVTIIEKHIRSWPESRGLQAFEVVLPVYPLIAILREVIIAELWMVVAILVDGLRFLLVVTGIEHGKPIGLQASENLGERPMVVANISQGVITQDDIECVVRKVGIHHVHGDETVRWFDAGVKVERPLVDYRTASAADNGWGDELLREDAGAAHVQQLRIGHQSRAYHRTEVPVHGSIAWLCAAVGTAARARRYAIQKKLRDRISAYPTDHPVQCT